MKRLLRRLRRQPELDASPVDARRGPRFEGLVGAPAEDERDRHRWFLDLARAGRVEEASERLASWILADRPGEGPDWSHASDAAVRLVYWGLGAGLLGDALDPDLYRRMAGSARAHAAFTAHQRSPNPLTQAVGLCVARAAFGAEQRLPLRAEAIGADGSGAPTEVQRAVALLHVASRFEALEPEAEGALRRGAAYLRAISTGGPVWGRHRYTPLLGETAEELADALAEPAVELAKDWCLRAYRASDQAVGHAKLKGRVSRVACDGGHLEWRLGGELLASIEAAASGLDSARIDGRRLTLGWGRRRLRAEGGRLQVVDHDGPVRLVRGPGFEALKLSEDVAEGRHRLSLELR